MMLTDREWLRFVTFALVAGGVLGSSYTTALVMTDNGPVGAMVGGIVGTGIIALLGHVVMCKVIDKASEPAADESTTTEPEANA